MVDPFDELRSAVGRSLSSSDVVTAGQVGRMAGVLGVAHPAPDPGDPLPHDWHTIFFSRNVGLDEMREDGTPAAEDFEVRSPLPNNRQLGRRSIYHDNLRIGDDITRLTEVSDIKIDGQDGGATALITIRDTISTPRGVAVVDERDRISFGADGPGAAMPSPPEIPAASAWQRTFDPSAVMMFRLSAVRYNAHRVHYDRDYTTKVEGLPGLVVPHTLISALMVELCRAEMPDRPLAGFQYKSLQRIYDLGPYTIFGQPDGNAVTFWANDHERTTCTIGEAQLAAER